MPGKHGGEAVFALPEDLAEGTYQVEISIHNEHFPLVCFATTAPRCGAFYTVGEMTVRR